MSKLKELYTYIKGEWFCRFFHKPLFWTFGGVGGRDLFNRRRSTYYRYECIKCGQNSKCGIYWESEREPKWLSMTQEEKDRISKIIKDLQNV